MHEGEEVVEEVLPLGAVGQFVELQERGEEKAFISRRRQSVRPTVRREIIKIMSGALSTKGGKEETQIIRLTSTGPREYSTHAREASEGRRGCLSLAAAPFSDALIFIGGAEGAIRYYDRE